MANKGSSSTPEIKINFSYESKTSANKKLKERISEIEQVAKGISVGIDFKANSESMKSLKSSLTTVKNNLNKLTLESFNKNLKESLTTAQKLSIELAKSARIVSKNRLINRTGNTNYDLKAVKEAEKQSLSSIKAQERAYKDMVKEQNKALKEAMQEQQKIYNKAQKSLEELAKKQSKLDDTKTNKKQKLDLNIEGFQKTINLLTQSGNISKQVLDDMQKEMNSFSMATADSEIEDFKERLKTLAKNDGSISQLSKKIETIQTKIGNLKTEAIKMDNKVALESLEELEEQLLDVQNASRLMSNGMEVNMRGVNPTIDNLNSGLKEIGESLKVVETQTTGFGATFKQIALTFGLLDLGREAVQYLFRSFKDGINTVVEMDSALADLNKVVEFTSQGLDKARTSAVEMGRELGSSAVAVVKAQAEFGRVYKDLDTINKMTRTAIMGANVMDGLTVDQVAKGLNTVISSLKLSANDVTTVLDSMNEVQNNFNISSDNMLEALGKVGSTAQTAGASLQQLEGYITAISEATGADGAEIGNSLRSMMTRVYKIGSDVFDEGDPEEALKAIGVAVRDASGEFRNINDILVDLNKIWGNLTQTQKIATAQVVAGNHQYDKFVSLLNNFGRATEATATAMDSVGSATKENEIYLNSIEGKMSSLRATMEGFWTNLIDSDLIRGGVDGLQLFADGLTGLQKTFGTTGLALGSLTTIFGMFNPSIRTLSEDIVQQKVTLGGLRESYEKFKVTMQQTGGAMTVAQKGTVALKTGFQAVANSALVAQIKVIALQTALSFGLGLAISGITSLLGGMWKGLTDVEGQIEAVGDASKKLSDTLENTKTGAVDLNSYGELRKKLDEINDSGEERSKLEKEIEEVKQRLYATDEQAYSILNNQNLSYEKQIDLLKQINEEKKKEQAKELEETMSGGFWGKSETTRAEEARKTIEANVKAYKELTELQKEANGGNVDFGSYGNIDLDQQNSILERLREQIDKGVLTIETYNSHVEQLKEANIGTDLSNIKLSQSTEGYVDSIKKSTNALKDNTNAKNENAVAGESGQPIEVQSIEDLTKSYSESLDKLQDIYDLSEKLNSESAMTPDLVSQVAKMFPEIGSRITDITSVQQYLNDKIKEQELIANQAYETLVMNDENYYKSKLLNDETWMESFRQSLISMGMSQNEAYNLDLKQFQNLNQLKTYAMNTLGKGIEQWLSQYIDTSANGYNIDFNNFKSFAEAKISVLNALNQEIKKVTENLNTMQKRADFSADMSKLFPSGSAQGQMAQSEFNKAQNSIKDYLNQLNNLNGALKDVENRIPNIGVGGLNLGNIAGNTISASPGSSGSTSGSSKSESTYKATLDQWYKLTDAIEDNNNAIELNKILRKRATGTPQELEYMNKEIELLEKQISLKKQLQAEMEKERDTLKKYIASRGGQFEGENLINYEALLDWTAIGDEQIASYKALEEAIKSYTKLCNSEIPNIVQEWEELADAIKDVKKEQFSIATKFEQDLYNVISYYAKKENDLRKQDLENEKKSIEEKKKLLEERKKMLQESFEKEDREDAIAEAQQTLNELDAQIQEALRSGDKELAKRLREQYAEQQKALNEQIRDQERENALNEFDKIGESYDDKIQDLEDVAEELDKKLEEFLSPSNINKVIADAMNSGFVNIMGQTVEVNQAMSEFLKETTVGVYTTKEALKELEDQLKSIGGIASQLPSISDSLGLPEYSGLTGRRSVEMQSTQLVINSPLVNVESLDNNSINEFNNIMNEKINWLINEINGKFSY